MKHKSVGYLVAREREQTGGGDPEFAEDVAKVRANGRQRGGSGVEITKKTILETMPGLTEGVGALTLTASGDLESAATSASGLHWSAAAGLGLS